MDIINKTTSHSGKHSLTSPWILWGIGTLFYLYQFVVRVAPSVMADDWILWFSIDTAILGTIVSLFYVAYSGMQVPLGLLFDKYGPRRLMSIAGIIIALGCFITFTSHSIFLFSLGRLLIGLGSACGFLGTLKIATLCFPEEKLGMLAGLTTAIGTLGGIVGGAPLSFLNDIMGWQNSMLILAIAGLLMSLAAYHWLRYLPKPKKVNHISFRDGFSHLISGLRILTHSPFAWRVSLFAFCMYAPLSAFADIWGVPFFKDAFGYDEISAASFTGTIFFGIIIGGILLGRIIKLFGNYYSMVIGAFSSLILFSMILYLPMGEIPLFICLFLLGVAFAPECIAFTLVYSVLPNDRGGIAVGFTNMVTMASGVLLQPLIGWILDLTAPANLDSVLHYQIALSTVVGCLLLACVLALSFKDENVTQATT